MRQVLRVGDGCEYLIGRSGDVLGVLVLHLASPFGGRRSVYIPSWRGRGGVRNGPSRCLRPARPVGWPRCGSGVVAVLPARAALLGVDVEGETGDAGLLELSEQRVGQGQSVRVDDRLQTVPGHHAYDPVSYT